MKTTVVPAQITTVEDRIAGNFTFAQIFLMIISLILGTVIYVVLPPRMHLGSLKLTLIVFQFLLIGGLAIRINGKIIAEWLATYFRYSKRPRQYVFTKNDETGREKVAVIKRQEAEVSEKKKESKIAIPTIPLSEEAKVAVLLTNPSLTVSFELAKKGGIDVSLSPVKD